MRSSAHLHLVVIANNGDTTMTRIVGQVAISGNHQWIFSGENAMNSYLSLELCNEWQTQFAAGIKGGMSNELYSTIARVPDGIYKGIAIGGDVFPGSTLSDHVLRFNIIPQYNKIVAGYKELVSGRSLLVLLTRERIYVWQQ